MKHQTHTESIIRAFYKVYNTLGYGFLEKVHQNALYLELCANGHTVETQKPIAVYYEGKREGNYFADMLVDGVIILERKAAESGMVRAFELQLINYLRATDLEVGLLLNFGEKPAIRRKIFDNHLKKALPNGENP